MTARLIAFAAALLWNLTAMAQSGTLPVLYIDTEGNAPVSSRDTYLAATYRLDAAGFDCGESLSGTLLIKGRGNYTWSGFDKKPYRLKLDTKAALMGMPASRHWTLLAHADDNLGFMRNAVGFEIGRRLGMDYVPRQEPVEVVLNGDYIGLYFLTEKIRVAKNRVNITEQADNSSDPEEITGGWLLEIDNYREPESQIELKEGNGATIWIKHHSPEVLSTTQRQWLTASMQDINNAIYVTDKSSREWENLIDMESIAKFYLVQELLDGCESFHGSCYFYRDRGADTKWIWGPLWDLGNTYNRGGQRFIYDDAPYGNIWIEELAKFPRFQDAVRAAWLDFRANDLEPIRDYITEFTARISGAGEANHRRWPNYGNADIPASASEFRSRLNDRINWLAGQWGGSPATTGIFLRGEMTGWATSDEWEFTETGDGQYALHDVTLTGKFKVGDTDWSEIDFGVATQGTKLEADRECALTFKGENISVNAPLHCVRLVFTTGDNPSLLAETVSGIIDLGSGTGENYPVEYYDLQGRKADGDNLAPGIYIRRAGTKTTKILIR